MLSPFTFKDFFMQARIYIFLLIPIVLEILNRGMIYYHILNKYSLIMNNKIFLDVLNLHVRSFILV